MNSWTANFLSIDGDKPKLLLNCNKLKIKGGMLDILTNHLLFMVSNRLFFIPMNFTGPMKIFIKSILDSLEDFSLIINSPL